MLEMVRKWFPLKEFNINGQTYRFDSLLFNIYILALSIFVAVIIMLYGTNNLMFTFYMVCPNETNEFGYIGQCQNPLYNNPEFCGKKIESDSLFCTKEFLNVGEELGRKPPININLIKDLITLSFVLMFFLNHYLHNQSFSFKKLWESIGE